MRRCKHRMRLGGNRTVCGTVDGLQNYCVGHTHLRRNTTCALVDTSYAIYMRAAHHKIHTPRPIVASNMIFSAGRVALPVISPVGLGDMIIPYSPERISRPLL